MNDEGRSVGAPFVFGGDWVTAPYPGLSPHSQRSPFSLKGKRKTVGPLEFPYRRPSDLVANTAA